MSDRLVLTSFSPRIVGLNGTLKLETLTADAVGELIAQAAQVKRIVSLVTFESTCDVLAMLAGLRGIHRYRREIDGDHDLTLAHGDRVLISSLKPRANGKSQDALGARDFEFTLATFMAAEHRSD